MPNNKLRDTSFEELLEQKKREEKQSPFKLNLPVLGIEAAKKALEKQVVHTIEVREKAPEAERFVAQSLAFIADVKRAVTRYGKGILDGPYEEEGRKITVGEKVQQLEEANRELFSCREGEVRRAAHRAKLRFLLRPQEDRDEEDKLDRAAFLDIVRQLQREGYLEEDPKGPIRVWKKSFSLSRSNEFGPLGDQEEEEVRKLVAAHTRHIREEYHEELQSEEEKLKEQADSTVSEIWDEKKGTCLMYIPKGTMIWKDRETGEENERSLPNGKVLVVSNEDGIQLAGGALGTGLERQVREIKRVENEFKRKIAIPLEEFKTPDDNLLDKDKCPEPRVSPKLRPWAAKYKAVWHLLRRGFELHLKRRQGQEAREKLKEQGGLSPKEFLLEGKCGKCYLEWRLPWIDGEDKFFDHPGILVERFPDKETGKTKIRMFNCLPQHASYFEGCMTANGFFEGEKFEGLPPKLGRFLRAMWKVIKAADVRRSRNGITTENGG